MHTTKPTSSAGQTRGCTMRPASTSISTETAIFTASHNMKLTADVPGAMLESRLVMPRAIKAPGNTTAAAPYNSDHPTSLLPVASQPIKAATTPTPDCTTTTHQGDTTGSLARSAAACSRVSGVTSGFADQASCPSSAQAACAATPDPTPDTRPVRFCAFTRGRSALASDIRMLKFFGGKPREYTGKPLLVRRFGLAALLLGAALGLAGCSAAPPLADGAPAHHRPGGFQNNHLDFQPKGLGQLLRWRWNAFAQGLPPPPAKPTPQVAPDLAFVQANARAGAAMQPAVTWIGHATVLVQAGGINALTDPIFSQRASPVGWVGPQRAQPPGLALQQLPHIDLVVVSHNHYDHLDAASVRALNAQAGGPPLFVVPLGLKAWLADQGITRVTELDWWQSTRLAGPAGEVEVVLTPVQHWSGRGLFDRMQTLWAGFVVITPQLNWFHAGDTGYSPDFAHIRERLAPRLGPGGLGLALLPVGAYEPRWFMADQHVNPAEAVKVHRDLGARRSLGMHWGTFALTDEALDEPPRALAAARVAQGVADDDFFVLTVGQTRRLPAR